MPRSKKKERTLGPSKLANVFSTRRGLFDWLADKEIAVTPPTKKKTHRFHAVNTFKCHEDMVKRIDALIEQNEQDAVFEVVEHDSETKPTTMGKIAEIRNPLQRRPERSPPSLDAPTTRPVFNKVGAETELFDVELPASMPSDFRIITSVDEMVDPAFKRSVEESGKARDFHTWMLGINETHAQQVAMSFGRTKVNRTKGSTTQKRAKNSGKTTHKPIKNTGKQKLTGVSHTASSDERTTSHTKMNSVTKTKQELEETKKRIEEQKKALREAEKQERVKAMKLKQQLIEKQRRAKQAEKRKRLEQRKAVREAKQQEQEQKKRKKVLERQKRLELQQKEKEEKMKRLEQQKKERAEGLKRAEQEKMKRIEQQQREKAEELKRAERERMKRLEQQQKEKAEKLKRIEQEKKERMKKKIKVKKKKAPKLVTSKTHHFLHMKKEVSEKSPMIDDDLIKVLTIADNLLEKLPNDAVDKFVQSKDFELYEKVISKYKIK